MRKHQANGQLHIQSRKNAIAGVNGASQERRLDHHCVPSTVLRRHSTLSHTVYQGAEVSDSRIPLFFIYTVHCPVEMRSSCLDKILKGIFLFRCVHLLHHHTVVIRCCEARRVVKVKVTLRNRVSSQAKALDTCLELCSGSFKAKRDRETSSARQLTLMDPVPVVLTSRDM